MIKSNLKKSLLERLWKNRPSAVPKLTGKIINRCMDYMDGIERSVVKVEPVNPKEWDDFVLDSIYDWIQDKL